MTGHVRVPPAALADQLPGWATLLRAPNPGPMTLEGTNTWLLRAPDAPDAVVIDPGPADPDHLAAIAGAGPVGLILLTHGHADHTEGVEELRALTGAVVRGPLRADQDAERTLVGGDVFDAGGLRLRVLATPGHTADSACFLVEGAGERAVCTGDTILGRGTTVVAHPDGDLAHYLASLAALAAYSGVPALPGHGPALADCAAAARFYLAHRQARLDQVRQAVAAGATTAAEVVARVYADVAPALRAPAEWSVRAQLAYLDAERSAAGRDSVERNPAGRDAVERNTIDPNAAGRDPENGESGPGTRWLESP